MFNLARLSAPVDVGAQPKYTKTEWTNISDCLETKLRPWVLRYAKLTDEQMVKVVSKIIPDENIGPDNRWFKKAIDKVRSNQSTWKHQTLGALQISTNKT